MPFVVCETLPSEVKPVVRNTSAVDKFNKEIYLDAFDYGIAGLHDWVITDELKAIRDISRTQWQAYETSRTLDSSFQKTGISNIDVWGFSQKIKNVSELNKTRLEGYSETLQSINNAFEIFQESIGLKAETEKDKFVSKYFLRESINNANRLIYQIFGTTKTESKLYVDPEESDCKFFNITIKPENVSEDDIDSLLDKFDELQDRFFETTQQVFSSKILFHIKIV